VWLIVRLAAALTVLTFVLSALGFPIWMPAAGSAAVVALVARRLSRAGGVGRIAVPRTPGTSAVLSATEDRLTMIRCVAVARRIQRTWPGLAHMIHPSEADPLLARALWELGGILARRQHIRCLRDDLAAVSHAGVPADSTAVRDLQAQRAQVEVMWRDVNAQVRDHADRLQATATAGERFIREQRVSHTAGTVRAAIAGLTATRPGAAPDAARDLAERTAAVVAAYRDLARRHGAT
jgi:hypothetical protein